MNLELIQSDSLRGELKITIEHADYAEKVDASLKNYRKRVELPGFRKGTVPASLVKQRFGKSILAEEINGILQAEMSKYISEKNLDLLGSPIPKEGDDVGDWDNPATFVFSYELGFAPSFDLKLDKKMSFTLNRVDLSDELVNRQMNDFAKRHGQLSKPEVTEDADMVMAELTELNEDGSVKEGGIANKSSVFIEYIKDEATKASLIGKSIGDVVVVDPFMLNADHEDLSKMLGITHHELHHLNSKFNLHITEIMRMLPAELNQELFDKLFEPGAVTSEEQMRERVKADLANMFEKDSEWLFKRDFARQIVDLVDIQLPDDFLKRFITITNDKPIDAVTLEMEYPGYARGLRWQLIENKIIKENELKVSVDDAMAFVKEQLVERFKSYGLPVDDERVEELAKQTLSKQEEAKNVYDSLYETAIMKVVMANCNIEEKAVSYEEFRHMSQH